MGGLLTSEPPLQCRAQGYLPIRQSPSMFLCSSFSIAAGGSLGPEAPLLALCAATTSWLGRKVRSGFRGLGQVWISGGAVRIDRVKFWLGRKMWLRKAPMVHCASATEPWLSLR